MPARKLTHIVAAAIATSVLAVCSVIWTTDTLTWNGVAVLIAGSVVLVGSTILLLGLKDNAFGGLFAYGALARIIVVALITVFPPEYLVESPASSLARVYGVLYKDEAWYIAMAELSKQWMFGNWFSIPNPPERIAIYYAVIFWFVDDNSLIWGRLANASLTTLSSLVIYDSLSRSISIRSRRLAWWFSGFAPVLVMWSGLYLKEPIVTLGVALILNAAIRIQSNKWSGSVSIMILLGGVLCAFARPDTLILLLAVLCLAMVMSWRQRMRHTLFPFIFGGLIGSLILVSLASVDLAAIFGRDPSYFERQTDLAEGGYVNFPFFTLVTALPEPFRNLGYGALLMISPVITGVWTMIPILGSPNWLNFATSAYATTWWMLLPLWPISVWAAIRKRDSWWLLLGGILIIWILASANMRFGAGADAMRYREAYVPLTIILALRGYDYIVSESRFPRRWISWLKIYGAAVVALILLRGLGVLQM